MRAAFLILGAAAVVTCVGCGGKSRKSPRRGRDAQTRRTGKARPSTKSASGQQDPKLVAEGKALLAEHARAIKRYHAPAKVNSNENACVHYRAAQVRLAARSDPPYGGFKIQTILRVPPANVVKIEGMKKEAFDRAKAYETDLRKALDAKECYYYTVAPRRHEMVDAAAVVKVLSLSQECVLRGLMLEADGRFADAARAHADAIRIGFQQAKVPDAMVNLFGVKMLRGGVNGLIDMLAREPGKDTVQEVIKILDALPPSPFHFAEAYEWDRVLMAGYVWSSLKIIADAGDRTGLRDTINEAVQGMDIPKAAVKAADGDLKAMREVILTAAGEESRMRKEVIAAARKPLPEALPLLEKIEKGLEREKGDLRKAIARDPSGYFALLARENLSSPKSLLVTYAKVEAMIGALKILAAASLVKAKTGSYPASLSATARDSGIALPKDPFSGRSFVYRLEGGMPLVESAGKRFVPDAYKGSYEFGLAAALKTQKEVTSEFSIHFK